MTNDHRTVLFDHSVASSSMKQIDDTSDASARFPARAPLTVTSISAVRARHQAQQIPARARGELPLPRLRQQRRVVLHRGCGLQQSVEPERSQVGWPVEA
jgi:hypothetical protein